MANDSSTPSPRTSERFYEGQGNVDFAGAVDSLTHLLRAICLVGVFALLVTAAYYALDVFRSLGQLVRDPSTARPAVEAIANMISADELVLQQNDQPLRLGELLAYVLLLASYLLWLYVPATILSVCSRVLLSNYSRRGRG